MEILADNPQLRSSKKQSEVFHTEVSSRPSISRELKTREQSLADLRMLASFLALNTFAWWLGYMALGGSVMLSEVYEGALYVKGLGGDEIPVSPLAHDYSFFHTLSVIITVPALISCFMGCCYEWLRLRLLLRHCRLYEL